MAPNNAARTTALHALPCKILLLLVGLLLSVVIAGLVPFTAQAIGYYDVWVGDVHVDGYNKDDVLNKGNSHNGSTGKVSFKMVDSSQGHAALNLDNANIKVADIKASHAAGIFVGPEIKQLDIYLTGINSISMPSGSLSSGNIYGIAGFGAASDDSKIRIYPKKSGSSLSMNLSSNTANVFGIYNNNDGVEIESVNLSAMLSSGGDAWGIWTPDGEIDIAKAAVNMSVSGAESAEGLHAYDSVLVRYSTVNLNTGQYKKSSYGAYGIRFDSLNGFFNVMNDSRVNINVGESSNYNYGVSRGFVFVTGDSVLNVNTGYASTSIGMNGSELNVEDGSSAGFSGYTQAIGSGVNVGYNTKSLGAFVSMSTSFRGGFTWDETAGPLSAYRYVHFPAPIGIVEAIIGAISDQKYTGKAIMPAITVIFGNTVLSSATDYAVSYANNVKPGKATVTITGKGAFSGTKTAVFTISHTVKWNRIWGQTAPDTMKKIAAAFGKTKYAVVTSDVSYKDALAASSLAGKYNAIVLMTKKGSLTPQAKAAMQASGVNTVIVVGSTSDVTTATQNAIKKVPGVKSSWRVNGNSASAKAVNVAKKTGTSDTVIIATQNGYQDALSIAPYAYATKSPILYAEGNKKLSNATVSYIKSAKFKKAIVVGGPIALPASIDSQLAGAGIKKANITRLAGANAYRTSELIAKWSMGKLGNGNHDKYKNKVITYVKFQPAAKMKADKLAVSTGQNWLDALSGAALCGKNRSVMLLADTKGGNHYANAVNYLKAYKLDMSSANIFGGTSAVSAATANALANATK
jgi:putative cell wall-binding protein